MKKLFIILVIFIISLTSCVEQNSTGTTKSGEGVYQKVCIDGVEYLQREGGYHGYMAPHFKQDGSLYICE